MSGNSPEAGGTPAGTVEPYARHHRFSARVLLTTVLILFALTLVFVFIRLLLYAFVPRSGGRGGLGAGILRSINSFGRIGSRRGLDASALSALPVTAYRKKESAAGASAGGGPDSDCAVCLSELADGDKVRELPNCGHVFHVECVDAWLRSRTTCPLCRAEAESGPKAEAAQSSATQPPPQPALFGAGGTLIVTVDGFPDALRAAHGSTSGLGQMVSSHT